MKKESLMEISSPGVVQSDKLIPFSADDYSVGWREEWVGGEVDEEEGIGDEEEREGDEEEGIGDEEEREGDEEEKQMKRGEGDEENKKHMRAGEGDEEKK